MTDAQALLWTILAAGVVLVGARGELERRSWGRPVWRAMLIALGLAACVALYALWRGEPERAPVRVQPSADAIAT